MIFSFTQKYHRELCLLLVVLFGLSCGHLAATLIGSSLRPPEMLRPDVVEPVRTSSRHVTTNDLNQILQRNIFDPASRSSASNAFTAKVDSSTEEVSRSRTDFTLFGTMVAGSDSLALIKAGQELNLYHLDEALPGGGKLETVERKRVVIRNRDQSTSVLELVEAESRSTVRRSRDNSNGGIRSLGDNRWKVARSVADTARQDIGQELRLAQMEPRLVDGKTDGFVIRMLNPRSLLAKMGLLRADVVLRVNNMTLDSPEKALQVMQQLREARRISVDIERRGQPQTFVYEID